MSNDQYIFISYAHKDTGIVLPCINAMKAKHLNVWYDEGIQAGSEWPEYIADKVVHCTKFVLFISRAYLESQNCKRELNFAISRKKDILSVFIEDVELSPGMEMQLGTYQSVFKKRFPTDAAFHESLCNEQWLDVCRLPVDGQPAGRPSEQPAQETSAAGNTAAEGPASQPHFEQTPPPQAASDSVSDAFSRFSATVTNEENWKNAFASVKTGGSEKNRIIAALLAIFLGVFGAHRFYLKKYKSAAILLILAFTPLIAIPAIVGVIEGIYMLTLSDDQFRAKYC